MRLLSRNKSPIYYALASTTSMLTDSNGDYTGELQKTYADPEEILMSATTAKGDVRADRFGMVTDYDMVLMTEDMSCPIAEDTILWIGVSTSANYNYVVTSMTKSLNSISYAAKKVMVE